MWCWCRVQLARRTHHLPSLTAVTAELSMSMNQLWATSYVYFCISSSFTNMVETHNSNRKKYNNNKISLTISNTEHIRHTLILASVLFLFYFLCLQLTQKTIFCFFCVFNWALCHVTAFLSVACKFYLLAYTAVVVVDNLYSSFF